MCKKYKRKCVKILFFSDLALLMILVLLFFTFLESFFVLIAM